MRTYTSSTIVDVKNVPICNKLQFWGYTKSEVVSILADLQIVDYRIAQMGTTFCAYYNIRNNQDDKT